MDFDFGYGGGTSSGDTTPPNNNNAEPITNLGNNGEGNDSPTDINNNNNGGGADGGTNGDNNTPPNSDGNRQQPAQPVEQNDDKNNAGGEDDSPIQPGATLEIDGVKYTINENKEVVDDKGAVFKKADEVDAWLKTFDVDDNNDDASSALSIERFQQEFGIEIVDDENNPIVFENTPEGINSYIQAVVETTRESIAENTIDALYDKFPFLESTINYYVANGNSLDGYGTVPDRSNITIEKDNEQQHQAIIRTAWEERGQKGDVETYLQYLKSQDQLYDVAKEELEGLQEHDAELAEQMAEQAEQAEKANIENTKKYWNGVKATIDNRVINGYKIPETIIMSKDGKQVTATPNDFFNYVYQTDASGKSAYENDLAKKTPQQRMDDELLAAYITFSGGSYSSLVKMAINEEKVNTIRLKSKTARKSTVKVNPAPTNQKKEVDLGYN